MKWLLRLLIVVAVTVVGAAVILWRYPLASLALAGRAGLRLQGFEKVAIQTPGGQVVYFRAGAGPPLVFLHGANDQAGTWVRVAPAFTARYTVIVADLAGHGDSEPAEGPLTGADLLNGVQAVMDVEAPQQPAVLVGNSLGGWIALVYALRSPDRVERVVSVNGAIDRGESNRASASLLPKSRVEARQTISQLVSPDSGLLVPGFVLDDLVRRSPTSPLARLMAAPPETLTGLLIDDRLDEIRPPVSMVWGADDRLLSVTYAQRAVSRIPNARLQVLEHCGHMPQRECPGELLGRLREVLVPRSPH